MTAGLTTRGTAAVCRGAPLPPHRRPPDRHKADPGRHRRHARKKPEGCVDGNNVVDSRPRRASPHERHDPDQRRRRPRRRPPPTTRNRTRAPSASPGLTLVEPQGRDTSTAARPQRDGFRAGPLPVCARRCVHHRPRQPVGWPGLERSTVTAASGRWSSVRSADRELGGFDAGDPGPAGRLEVHPLVESTVRLGAGLAELVGGRADPLDQRGRGRRRRSRRPLPRCPPRMAAVSSVGMSQKALRSHSFVWGHVPSGWGKSLPHMRLPTPIS